ncbi:MAG: GAF domain-containing protein [Bernardetiaceae bacterium]
MTVPFLNRQFKSIRGKLRFSFLITTVNILLIISLFIWFNFKAREVRQVTDTLKTINLRIERAKNLEKDFYIDDAVNTDFYESGQSQRVDEHRRILKRTTEDLSRLKRSSEVEGLGVGASIDSLILEIELFDHYFDSLVSVISERGFKSYGLEGDLRRALGRVINSGYAVDQKILLSIQRYEKDYILRKDTTTINRIFREVDQMIFQVPTTVTDAYGRAYVESALEQYKRYFAKLVDADLIIGNQNEAGLRGLLAELSFSIEDRITRIDTRITTNAEQTRTNTIYAVTVLFLLFVILNFWLSDITTKDLSKPLEELSSSIHQAVEQNFSDSVKVYQSERSDEIGMLSQDFEYMLQNVQARTQEVVEQKEKISTAYQNVQELAKIGQEITANLEVEDILNVVILNLQRLVRLSSFSIGVFDPKHQSLHYKEAFEDGTRRDFSEHLNDKNKLGTYTFLRQESVIINYFPSEKDKLRAFPPELIKFTSLPAIGLPLTSKGKKLGVLIVHPQASERFTDFEIDMIRNIAVYTIIALDNALIYANLEETVAQRTEEVVAQKEEIERSKEEIERAYLDIQLLSEIGKIITGYLSVPIIIRKVYEQINNLMDVAVFGIGVSNLDTQQLVFEASIEEGIELETYYYGLSDEDSLSVKCFNHEEDIIISDYAQEVVQSHLQTQEGNYPKSLVYMPIKVKGRTIGVLSVHSFKAHAYTNNHLNILRNVAIYAGIALENAATYQQIEEQKEEIQTATKKLTASINYAKRIQEAMLPDRQSIKRALPDSFILFRPRDVVSGDFFWFAELGNGNHVIAAVDCTGHGVPGALMSMIGNELLNEVVNLKGIEDPAHILTEMHQGVRQDLKQRETQNRDGMDMSICVIDYAHRCIRYAGAKNPLVYIQNGDLHYVRGEKFPIGGKQLKQARKYITHEVSFLTPTTFYIYSDGYQDQFGGDTGQRKFMAPRFRSLLHNIHFLPMAEQEEILDTTIQNWMKHTRQIDDILVMGFALSPA